MGKITIDEDYLKFLLKQERIRGKVEWNSKIGKKSQYCNYFTTSSYKNDYGIVR